MKKQISILLILAVILILCTGALAAAEDVTTPDLSAIITETPSASITIPSLSPNVTNTCTCCGETYTGLKCPNCMPTRCSVCNKCPIHCTCENAILVTGDHYAYITGFANGTFQPEGSLTRAQAAAIFYRLLQNKGYDTAKCFTDVHASDWFYPSVTALASKGILDGYTDGTFRPQKAVTRAEFCTMASKFFDTTNTNINFSDVPQSHWAYKYIASAVANDWIEDSTGAFYPDTPIMRQDAVTIVNNMTARTADTAYIEENIKKLTTFRDVKTDNKNYYAIIEAANSHSCSHTGETETWTAMKK